MAVSEIIKYVKISDLLHTSGQPKADQFSFLASEKFELVINLGLHDDPRYSVPEQPEILKSLGIEYIHIPVQFSSPTYEDLATFFAALERAKKRKTLVHCAHNKRVSVFIALHRIIKEGWSASNASQAAAEVWPPDEVWRKFFDETLAEHG